MINPNDEHKLRDIVREMNLGFSAPQNGGVDGSTVMILQNEIEPEDIGEEGPDLDAGQIVNSVIEDLNHLKMDLDQGCQAEAQIDILQKCCDKINAAIEKIGNTSGDNHQNSAFSGINSQGNQDPGSEAPSQMDLNTMSQMG